ncbi:MAG TPA: 2-amino-4-hydroxy-6-hydroxymethyldihydropteridine diphosphokinase [Burkholderiales bacterium]|nr:2-amino-4-hydroxy-6-hydroxymethyldihydropteridine diphosphokinase [Burkholderiales bacterium]
MTLAYVGMGANLGDPRTQLDTAWQAFQRMPQTKAIARSSLYRSAPVGYEDQPDFLNCVAKLDTALPAPALLAELQEIERRLGRTRSFLNAPRTIDLDLLLYGAQTLDDPAVTLPHPRMHERAFVLAPLVELEPAIEIPGRGTAAELLRACGDQRVQRIAA